MKLFELFATLSLDTDEFSRGVNDVSRKASTMGDKISAFAAKAGKVAAGAAVATGAAVGSILKSSLENYAEYEQLVGGVETLFKDSSKKVQDYAHRAFETAGMSANTYMETVTSFSASLLQSLGGDTAAAAEVAHMAIVDMSDNANKMGTSMEMIQNAYQGFAKQNYTMLDNLKLGFGGTKEEMQRLLKTATELTGTEYDLSNLSDVFEAIHVIQQQIGITGTTAEEAKNTISGSIAAWKANWEDLVTSFGTNNAELQQQYVDDLIASTGTVIDNLVPVVSAALDGIGVAAMAGVENIWDNHLPGLVEAGANTIVDTVNAVFGTNIPKISNIDFPTWEEVKDGAKQVWAGIQSGFNGLANAAQLVGKFVMKPSEWTDSDSAALESWWNDVTGKVSGFLSLTFDMLTPPGTAENIRSWWANTKASVGKLMLQVGYSFDQFNPQVNMQMGLGSATHGDGSTGGGSGKGFAVGLDYVPNDNFLARLHEGEAVLTKQEATDWRRGSSSTETLVADLREAVVSAVRDGMTGLAIQMDGQSVGDIVTDRVSRNIAQAAYNGRY